jgi:hypothetical protein
LWKSSVTQEQVNIAQKAHIYAFSDDGPRANPGITDEEINSIDNLMLVCHECHEKIDDKKDGGRYNAGLLQQWKAEHEKRIDIVTDIASDKKSSVVLYGANIGEHGGPLHYRPAAEALFPDRYPAEDHAIVLGRTNSFAQDRDEHFFEEEARHLKGRFDRRVRDRLADGSVSHLSVFGLAPQPLLILLGSLTKDIVETDVYQRHREPVQSWKWPEKDADSLGLRLDRSDTTGGKPVLVVSLTDTISRDRITDVLGEDVTLWHVTVEEPGQNILRSKSQLSEYRNWIQGAIREIESVHGKKAPLHIFPAMGVAFAIELGRIRQPKANMPWRIYDQNHDRGGFIPALDIN